MQKGKLLCSPVTLKKHKFQQDYALEKTLSCFSQGPGVHSVSVLFNSVYVFFIVITIPDTHVCMYFHFHFHNMESCEGIRKGRMKTKGMLYKLLLDVVYVNCHPPGIQISLVCYPRFAVIQEHRQWKGKVGLGEGKASISTVVDLLPKCLQFASLEN